MYFLSHCCAGEYSYFKGLRTSHLIVHKLIFSKKALRYDFVFKGSEKKILRVGIDLVVCK